MVTVALPSMRADLGFSATGLQWVINAYTLIFARLPAAGGTGGRPVRAPARVRLGADAVHAGEPGVRPGAGSGGAGDRAGGAGPGRGDARPGDADHPHHDFTEPRERARALGIWSASLAAAGRPAALLGGILTDTLSWRWIFLDQRAVRHRVHRGRPDGAVREPGRRAGAQPGLAGAITITGGLTALRLRPGAHGQGRAGFDRDARGDAVAAVRLSRSSSSSPGWPPPHWRRWASARASAAGANLAMPCVGGGDVHHVVLRVAVPAGGAERGARGRQAFLPAPIAVIWLQLAARLVPRVGRWRACCRSRPSVAAGLRGCRGCRHDRYATDILGPITVAALGSGCALRPSTYAATAGVRPRRGAGVGLINATRQVGGAVGLAALATIAVHQTAHAWRRPSPPPGAGRLPARLPGGRAVAVPRVFGADHPGDPAHAARSGPRPVCGDPGGAGTGRVGV